MKRAFLVDVTISLPKGDSQDDWSYVGHLYADFDENDNLSTAAVAEEIRRICDEFIREHPQAHDCMDNSLEIADGYYCRVCNKNTTKEHEKIVKLSQERRVHERATDIVKKS